MRQLSNGISTTNGCLLGGAQGRAQIHIDEVVFQVKFNKSRKLNLQSTAENSEPKNTPKPIVDFPR